MLFAGPYGGRRRPPRAAVAVAVAVLLLLLLRPGIGVMARKAEHRQSVLAAGQHRVPAAIEVTLLSLTRKGDGDLDAVGDEELVLTVTVYGDPESYVYKNNDMEQKDGVVWDLTKEKVHKFRAAVGLQFKEQDTCGEDSFNKVAIDEPCGSAGAPCVRYFGPSPPPDDDDDTKLYFELSFYAAPAMSVCRQYQPTGFPGLVLENHSGAPVTIFELDPAKLSEIGSLATIAGSFVEGVDEHAIKTPFDTLKVSKKANVDLLQKATFRLPVGMEAKAFAHPYVKKGHEVVFTAEGVINHPSGKGKVQVQYQIWGKLKRGPDGKRVFTVTRYDRKNFVKGKPPIDRDAKKKEAQKKKDKKDKKAKEKAKKGKGGGGDGKTKPTKGGSKPTKGGSKPTKGGSKPTKGGSKPTKGGSKPTKGGSKTAWKPNAQAVEAKKVDSLRARRVFKWSGRVFTIVSHAATIAEGEARLVAVEDNPNKNRIRAGTAGKVIGDQAGGMAGAWAGGKAGAAIGAVGGPVGVIVGGAVGAIGGGIVGSVCGSYYGGKGAEMAYDKYFKLLPYETHEL